MFGAVGVVCAQRGLLEVSVVDTRGGHEIWCRERHDGLSEGRKMHADGLPQQKTFLRTQVLICKRE